MEEKTNDMNKGANKIKDQQIYVTSEGGKVGGNVWEQGVPEGATHRRGAHQRSLCTQLPVWTKS